MDVTVMLLFCPSSESAWLQRRHWAREEPTWWWAAGGRPMWSEPWLCSRARASKWQGPPVMLAGGRTEKNSFRRRVFLALVTTGGEFSLTCLGCWTTIIRLLGNSRVRSLNIGQFVFWNRLWNSVGELISWCPTRQSIHFLGTSWTPQRRSGIR